MLLALTRWEKVRIVAECIGIAFGVGHGIAERRQANRDREKDEIMAAMHARIEQLEAALVRRGRGKR